jgi:quercetin dioxygenase-like cupin family protein
MMMVLPALAAAPAAGEAQTGPQAGTGAQGTPDKPAAGQASQRPTLQAKVYHSAAIPYNGNETKKARRFFYGPEHSGYNLEMHETVLGPGVETHGLHSHPHQEIIIVIEGTVQVSMDGRTEQVEAGSVIFYEPDKPHNLRNIGTVPCRYYVVELRGRHA